MKHTKLLASFVLFTLCLFITRIGFSQTTHHVYSLETPWVDTKIQKDPNKTYSVNEALQDASEGDIIVLHEGVYRETISVTKNNVTIKSNENDYVLVTGAELVTNWSETSGMASGVMQADISSLSIQTDYTQLFKNGERKLMGRHPNNTTGAMMEPMDPNSGYTLLSNVYKDAGANGVGHATLENTTLPDVDLTNGIFRGTTGKMRNYIWGEITENTGNSVAFTAINNGVWKAEAAIKNTYFKFSWGFVFHKNLIDVPGEWYAENGTLYYLPEENASMEDMRIEIQVRERVLVLNNTTGASIQGINFVAGNVDMQSTNGATIDDCSMRYLYPFWTPKGYGQGDTDKKGIYLLKSSNNTFTNNYIAHSWGNMIALHNGENNTFENCVITDFGWVGVFTSGIHINEADNTNISKCTFGDSGRFQIRLDGGDAKVNILDCDFYGAMKMGEDAGPIEATSTGKIGTLDMKGSEIAYNKVHDVIGVPVCDGNYKKVKATAFYMEDTENYTAHHNLIYNIKHDVYDGPHEILKVGEFLYMGPRYNAMHKPVKYYNNTIWNVDENVSIWNILMDNWEELGVAEEDKTGVIDDGHFVNNIFMNGPEYRLSYNAQVVNSKGGKVSWAESPEGGSITTHDWTEYTDHCAHWGYHLNPENTALFDFSEGADQFVDAPNGDFTLKTGSPAIAAGKAIEGITSSASPDCGALEGSNRVLNAGSKLQTPAFKEEGATFTDIPETESVTFSNLNKQYIQSTTQFVLDIDFNVFEARDILVGMYSPMPENKFIINTKKTVQAEDKTVQLTLTLTEALPVAADYKMFVAVRPVGGNWQTTIVEETKYIDIVAEMAPEMLLLENVDTEVYNTITELSFDANYSVNEQRTLQVTLLSPSSTSVVTKELTLDAQETSSTVTFDVDGLLTESGSYTVEAKLYPLNNTQAEALLTATEQVSVTIDPISDASEKSLKQLLVYPNPVEEVLNIQMNNVSSQIKRIDIYTISGQKVATKIVMANQKLQQLDVSNLASGTYLAKIAGYENVKFIKK